MWFVNRFRVSFQKVRLPSVDRNGTHAAVSTTLRESGSGHISKMASPAVSVIRTPNRH